MDLGRNSLCAALSRFIKDPLRSPYKPFIGSFDHGSYRTTLTYASTAASVQGCKLLSGLHPLTPRQPQREAARIIEPNTTLIHTPTHLGWEVGLGSMSQHETLSFHTRPKYGIVQGPLRPGIVFYNSPLCRVASIKFWAAVLLSKLPQVFHRPRGNCTPQEKALSLKDRSPDCS